MEKTDYMSELQKYTPSVVRYIVGLVFLFLGIMMAVTGELPWILDTDFSQKIRPESDYQARAAILSGWICIVAGITFIGFELRFLYESIQAAKKKGKKKDKG